MTEEQKSHAGPDGVVAIMTAPDGHVVASVTDFNRSGYGGFTLQQAQEYRAARALDWAVVNAYCSSMIVQAISDHQAHEICQQLVRQHGYRKTVIAVGHAGETAK